LFFFLFLRKVCVQMDLITTVPFGLHPCSDIDNITNFNKNDKINISPGHIIFLGEGDNGIVLGLNGLNHNDRFAIKITYKDKFINEMKIACKLSNLKPFTQAFIHTYGWLQQLGLPKNWLKYLPTIDQKDREINWQKYKIRPLIYIFMEHSTFRLWTPKPVSGNPGFAYMERVSEDTALKLLFILLHGLYIARKLLKFSHNDIHDGQIMLFRRPDIENNIVLSEGFEIEDCPLIPKFIDFGTSVVDDSGNKFSADVSQLVENVFNKSLIPSIDELTETKEYENAAASTRDNHGVLLKLLKLDYFVNHNTIKKTQRTGEILSCMGCMSESTFIVKDTNFHVCDHCCKNVCFNIFNKK
jgi:hypothetical protein